MQGPIKFKVNSSKEDITKVFPHLKKDFDGFTPTSAEISACPNPGANQDRFLMKVNGLRGDKEVSISLGSHVSGERAKNFILRYFKEENIEKVS